MSLSGSTSAASVAFSFFLCCFSVLLGPSSAACNRADRSALLAFKAGITDDPSGLLATWSNTTDCCEWDGIECHLATGRVIKLTRPGHLSGDNSITDTWMAGTISPSLGGLSSLRRLDLSSLKQLHGPIPPSLGRLSHLEYLFLDGNNLTGPIPPALGNLLRLRMLFLNSNQLTGSIPPSLFSSPVLTLLHLDLNRLSGTIPTSIARLKRLILLDLHGNDLTGSIPSEIGSLKKLNYVHLSHNKISGSIPQSIGSLRELVILSLNDNLLSGPIPATVSGMSSLSMLLLSFNPQLHNPSTNPGPPSWLGEMEDLNQLELAGTGIVGPLPSWLSSASSITTLDLSSNNLTGELPRWIGNMTNLSSLNLSNNALESQLPEELGNLTRLIFLDLHSNKFTGGIRPVVAKRTDKLPGSNYYAIDLSWNDFSGSIDEDVGELPAMDGLNQFVVSHNRLSGGIPASLLNLSSLVELDVSYNRLTGRIPAHKFKFGADNFTGNPGLCGDPLPPCKR